MNNLSRFGRFSKAVSIIIWSFILGCLIGFLANVLLNVGLDIAFIGTIVAIITFIAILFKNHFHIFNNILK